MDKQLSSNAFFWNGMTSCVVTAIAIAIVEVTLWTIISRDVKQFAATDPPFRLMRAWLSSHAVAALVFGVPLAALHWFLLPDNVREPLCPPAQKILIAVVALAGFFGMWRQIRVCPSQESPLK